MKAEAAPAADPAPPKKRKLLLPLVATVLLGAAGFASTYLGLWTPSALLGSHEADAVEPEAPKTAFVTLPPIQVSLVSGRHSVLLIAAVLETEDSAVEAVTAQLPRVQDTFNSFLSGIDPEAFDKRGVLDIIKYELTARAREALPDLPVSDLLITEFRLK